MRFDDIVVGGGHNGLTAAAYLARAGRRVLVLEQADHLGGAAVSAPVFPGVPARLSRYSYLVSLLPEQICADLDLDISLAPRRFGSYTPDPADPTRGLLVDNEDGSVTADSMRRLTGSLDDLAAMTGFYSAMAAVARGVFPTMLEPLADLDRITELVAHEPLFTDLVTRPVGSILTEWFSSDLVRGLVATDALIGTFADLGDPSLRQNICLLYHLIGRGTGQWLVPVGGMGAVSAALARAAGSAGAETRTGARVTAIDPVGGTVTWQQEPADGSGEVRQWEASAGRIHAGCAPAVLNELLAAAGAAPVPTETDVEGAQLKVNLVLERLPRLRDGVDPRAAFSGTFHINESMSQLQTAYRQAQSGSIPDLPPCEIYCHTLSDRSILDPALRGTEVQTLTLFGLHLPARLFAGSATEHDAQRERALAATLASVNSVLAEPIESVLVTDRDGRPCIEARTPLDVQASVGMPGGNIFHRSLQWPWAPEPGLVGTWGVETPYPGLQICGAGARRGGGVSGIPGHNSARAALLG